MEIKYHDLNIPGYDLHNAKILHAVSYMVWAHHGQTRRYGSIPYAQHPLDVAMTLRTYQVMDPNVIIAAILHDIIEDTNIEAEVIGAFFGNYVMDLVVSCSDYQITENLSRAQRHTQKLLNYQMMNPMVHMIKMADMINNMPSIIQHDPDFAKVYIKEKLDMLKLMTAFKEQPIYKHATSIIEKYYREN